MKKFLSYLCLFALAAYSHGLARDGNRKSPKTNSMSAPDDGFIQIPSSGHAPPILTSTNIPTEANSSVSPLQESMMDEGPDGEFTEVLPLGGIDATSDDGFIQIPPPDNAPPILDVEQGAVPTSYRETIFRIKLGAEDPDGDELTYSLTRKPSNGTCKLKGCKLIYLPNPGFTGTEQIGIQVSDGELADSQMITFPVEEHPDSVGIHIDLNDSELSSDFLYDLYETNERLREEGSPLIKLEDKESEEGFVGILSPEAPDSEAIPLENWMGQIGSQDPQVAFSFHQATKDGEISWHVSGARDLPSETGKNLIRLEEGLLASNEQPNDPGESPQAPDPSSAPKTVPVLEVKNLPGVRAVNEAPNWYSLPGLGTFFDAGNNWIFEPSMGWCYAKVNQVDLSVWAYNEGLGWMWFSGDLPNVAYMVGDLANGWTYFPKSSVTEAGILYDYTNESWLKLN